MALDGVFLTECRIAIVGFATGEGDRGVVMISSDGGKTFRATNPGPSRIEAISVRSPDWVIGGVGSSSLGALLRSSDDGKTWTKIALPPDVSEVLRLVFLADGSIIAAVQLHRDAALLSYRRNSWDKIASVKPTFSGRVARFEVLKVNGNLILAGGTDGAEGILLVGRVGGPLRRSSVRPLSIVRGLDASANRLVVGGRAGVNDLTERGMVLSSTDEGRTWIQSEPPASIIVNDVLIRGDQVLALVGTIQAKGDALMELRAGTWLTIRQGVGGDPSGFRRFIDTSARYIVGDSGFLAA